LLDWTHDHRRPGAALWPPRSSDLTLCSYFYGKILSTLSFYRLCHRIYLSC
jgi:hypothetical protein